MGGGDRDSNKNSSTFCTYVAIISSEKKLPRNNIKQKKSQGPQYNIDNRIIIKYLITIYERN